MPFGPLVQRPIEPEEHRDIERDNIWTGALGNVYSRITRQDSPWYVFYADLIGFKMHQFAYLGSLIFLASLSLVFSSSVVRFCKIRNVPWAIILGLARLLWIIPAVHPCTPLQLGAIIVACTFLQHLAEPIWFSWFCQTLPFERRGRFWGIRTLIISALYVICGVTAALSMDFAPESAKFETCQWIIGIATALGLIDVVCHLFLIPEPPMPENNLHPFKDLAAPFKDKKFQRWLIVMSTWGFALGTTACFCIPTIMHEFGLGKSFFATIFTLVILDYIGIIPGSIILGRAIDKCGATPVLKLGHVYWAIVPLFYFAGHFMEPGSYTVMAWMGICIVVAGFVLSAGALNSWVKIRDELSPEEQTSWAAATTLVFALGAAGGAAVGGWVQTQIGIYVWIFGSCVRWLLFPLAFILQMKTPQMTVREMLEYGWRQISKNGKNSKE